MTAPVLTAQDPSPGFISWTAFNISYAGQGFSVAAGNTDKAYVWWEYQGGVGVLKTGDVVPTTLTSDDLLLFLNRSGIPISAQNSTFIDGSLLIDGTVAAAAMKTDELVVGGNIAQFATGYDPSTKETPTGAQAKADSARNLALGDVKTLWGHANDSTLIDGANVYTGSLLAQSMALADFTNYCRDSDMNGRGTWKAVQGSPSISYTSAGINGTPDSVLRFVNSGSAQDAREPRFPVTPGDQFNLKVMARNVNGPVPSAGFVYLSLFCYDSSGTSVAGSSAGNVALVSASSIAGWVELGGDFEIPAGTVEAELSIRTSSTVTAGTTLDFDRMQLRRKNGGDLLVDGAIDGQTITGSTLRTAGSGQRVVVTTDAGRGLFQMFSGHADASETYPGGLWADSSTIGTDVWLNTNLSSEAFAADPSASNAYVGLSTWHSDSRGYRTKIVLNADDVHIQGAADGNLDVPFNMNIQGEVIFNGTIVHDLNVGDYAVTIGSLADGGTQNLGQGSKYCRVTAAGRLTSSTTSPSSRRYKKNIEPLDVDLDAVLALTPRTYEYIESPGSRTGFIAEEAVEAGLSRWVGFEDPNDPTLVTGFDYEGFISAHHLVLQDHEARIRDLTEQIKALTA